MLIQLYHVSRRHLLHQTAQRRQGLRGMSWVRHIVTFVLTFVGLTGSLLLLGTVLEASGVFPFLGVDPRNFVVGGLTLGVIGGASSWGMARSIATWSMRVRPLEASDLVRSAGDVAALAERLGARFRLGRPPDVAVYPSLETNAFVVGFWPSRSLLCVSEGLLDRATPASAEAILAQLLARATSCDVAVLTFVHGVINTFTIFPARMLAFIFGTSLRTFEEETPSDGVEAWLMGIFETLFAGGATLVVRAASRAAERRADRAAAAVVGDEPLRRVIATMDHDGAPGEHRDAFIRPFKFGVTVKTGSRWISHHVPPNLRQTALRS